MKVIFVGTHYKKGMKALDSRTQSGRIIDMIINQLGDMPTEKINLFPTDYMPSEVEQFDYAEQFTPDGNALYVALGKTVQKLLISSHCVKVNHPGWALRRGQRGIKVYVRSVSTEIKNYMKQVVKTKCVRCDADVLATRQKDVYCDSCISEWVALH